MFDNLQTKSLMHSFLSSFHIHVEIIVEYIVDYRTHKTGHAKHILFCSSTLFGQFILLKIVTEITRRDLEMQIMN